MSERLVRLLYKTTCWTCGAPVPAGTTTWWDDDRRHATCTECFSEADAQDAEDAALAASAGLDERALRRLQIMRARQPRLPTR